MNIREKNYKTSEVKQNALQDTVVKTEINKILTIKITFTLMNNIDSQKLNKEKDNKRKSKKCSGCCHHCDQCILQTGRRWHRYGPDEPRRRR